MATDAPAAQDRHVADPDVGVLGTVGMPGVTAWFGST